MYRAYYEYLYSRSTPFTQSLLFCPDDFLNILYNSSTNVTCPSHPLHSYRRCMCVVPSYFSLFQDLLVSKIFFVQRHIFSMSFNRLMTRLKPFSTSFQNKLNKRSGQLFLISYAVNILLRNFATVARLPNPAKCLSTLRSLVGGLPSSSLVKRFSWVTRVFLQIAYDQTHVLC